jgi:hypothetical protein
VPTVFENAKRPGETLTVQAGVPFSKFAAVADPTRQLSRRAALTYPRIAHAFALVNRSHDMPETPDHHQRLPDFGGRFEWWGRYTRAQIFVDWKIAD